MSAPRWIALIALWLCAFAASGAASATQIDRYRLEIHRSSTQADAIDVTMELEYRSPVRAYKRDGFKFIGRSAPSGVQARTRDGQPLRATVSRESSSGEYRLDFALSEPVQIEGDQELRHVIVQFTQPIDEREHWTRYGATVSWTGQFRVPVRATVFDVSDFDALNSECVREGTRSTCRLSSPESLRLSRERPNAGLNFVALLLGLIGVVASLGMVLRDRYEHRVGTRGVVPPAPAPAYVPPSNDPKVYRAPLPLPKPQELGAPQLPEAERARWQQDVRSTSLIALGVIAVALFVISVAGSSWPVSATVLISCVVASVSALWWNKDDQPFVWPALAASVWLCGLVVAGLSGLLTTTVGLAFAVGIGLAIKNAPAGGSSGGSSSCSSSSCGGGGGGCGGGGGGGGCGG